MTKRNKVFLLLIITAIIVVVFLILRRDTNPENISISNQWNGLIPGLSTKEEVVQNLGQPKREEGSRLFFDSNSATRDTSVSISEDKVSLIKVINTLGEETYESLINTYGQPEIRLYGAVSEFGNYLYVYPLQGVAFMGNETDNSVLEIWYFEPLSSEEFLAKWGINYSLTPTDFEHE